MGDKACLQPANEPVPGRTAGVVSSEGEKKPKTEKENATPYLDG